MKTFPIMWPIGRSETEEMRRVGCPTEIPWDLIAPHADRARRNHQQSFETLARRGGLSPHEAVAVLTDRDAFDVIAEMTRSEAVEKLKRLITGES